MDSSVTHVKNKMGDFAYTVNEVIDAHNARDDELQQIKAKLADLEDRSRRNNIKFSGIPESVKPPDLYVYFQNILQEIFSDASPTDVAINRINRLPKPRHLPEHLPRDTIARIRFY